MLLPVLFKQVQIHLRVLLLKQVCCCWGFSVVFVLVGRFLLCMLQAVQGCTFEGAALADRGRGAHREAVGCLGSASGWLWCASLGAVLVVGGRGPSRPTPGAAPGCMGGTTLAVGVGTDGGRGCAFLQLCTSASAPVGAIW